MDPLSNHPDKKIRVLYVDDEPGLLEVAKFFLEKSEEFSVGTSTSAKDVIASPDLPEYDAIISDYQMPGMDGIAFLKAVRASGNDIPFILFTGRGREEVVIDAINNGVDFYLQKGGDPSAQFAELAHKVLHAVKRKREEVSRKKAEQELRESEAKFRSLVEMTPAGVLVHDLDGRVLYLNPEGLRLAEAKSLDDFAGMDVLSSIHPDDRAKVQEQNRLQRERQNIITPAEIRLLTLGGRPYPAEVTSKTVEYGGIPAVLVMFQDLSLRKKVEDELRVAYRQIAESEEKLRIQYDQLITSEREIRESEEKYRFLTEVTHDILYMIDEGGTFTHISPQVARYGYSPQEVISHNISEFVCEEDMEKALADLAESLSTGEPVVTLMRIRDKTGNLFWMEDNGAPVKTPSGDVVGLSGILRDVTGRINAEQALKESEEKFRTLVENSLDGTVITDLNGLILFANRAAGEIVDCPDPAILIGKRNVRDFFTPASLEAVLKDITRVAGGNDAFLVSYQLVTEKNRAIWVECLGKKITFSGTPTVFVSVRDITTRKIAEEALRASEMKFVTVFQSNPVPQALVSAKDGTFTDVNDAFMISSGYTREEVIGRTAAEIGIFVENSDYRQYIDTLRQNGRLRGMEVQCRSKGGSVRTCRFNSAVVSMNGGPHILSTIEDITPQKAAEEALIQSRERFSQVAENAGEWIWEVDPEGMYTYCSPVVESILGYTPEELVGRKHYYDLFASGTHEPLIVAARAAFRQRESFKHFVNPCRHKDGSTVILETSGAPFYDKEGGFIGYRGTDLDITGRVRVEDALRQANRKLNLLSKITRHDIMNQLMALDGFAALLKEKIPEPLAEDYLSPISRASSQISGLIQFTKEYESIGVHASVWQDLRSLVDRTAGEALDGTVALHNDLPAGVGIFADPLIAKVLFNLADNAVRHGGKITAVRFSSREEAGSLVVVCEDDGAGVAADDKERIFERGFGKNTGFGLAISREILDITGITIRETGIPGKGARFDIMVPAGAWRDNGTAG